MVHFVIERFAKSWNKQVFSIQQLSWRIPGNFYE